MPEDTEAEPTASNTDEIEATAVAEEPSEGAPAAAADEEESRSEEVTELRRFVEPKRGNVPDAELEELKPICSAADENHQQVLKHIKDIKAAEKVLQQFRARAGNVTPQDVEQAKQKFHQAKQTYLHLGNQINEGIKRIHPMAQMYPEDFLAQNLYKIYLSKLLSSLETRNPVEPFVEALSLATFDFTRHEVTVTEGESLKGLTVEKKAAQLVADTQTLVTMLEARYQKRQLHNRMHKGESRKRVIQRLRHFLTLDPEDLHTYIWLASLMSEELEGERNHNTRVALRDDILQYCKRAFAKIDDFLNLQGIQTLSERDKRRSEYVKTITAIRKPLVDSPA